MKLKILDKYIFKKLVFTYVYVVLILLAVLCVIEYTERNGDFIKNKAPGADITNYFLSNLPYWANMLSPLTIFIATVFVTARMAAHTEIIAMLSSGMSFIRFIMPYLAGSIVIGGLIYYLVGWVIPQTNVVRIEFERKYVKQPYYFEGRDVHIRISPDTYIYLESYSNIVKTGYRFSIETFDGLNLVSKLSAQRIVWKEEAEKWQLENCSVRKINGLDESLQFFPLLDTAINLYPKDFENEYKLHEMLTNDKLQHKIDEMKARGYDGVETYLVEKYERQAYPYAIIILTMIGVILSARKSRKGTSYQIAFGFVLAFVYIFFVMIGRSVAMAGDIPPQLAAWMPNIIFGLIGLTLYKTVPT